MPFFFFALYFDSDDKLKMTGFAEFVFDKVEDIVKKGKDACYQHFLLVLLFLAWLFLEKAGGVAAMFILEFEK